jgi:phenylacetate-CoA ligase
MITLQELVKKLEETEWNTLEQIQSRQEACLARIVDHHSRYNPHFKQRLADQGLTAEDVSTLAGLTKLKPITKRDIQQAGVDFQSTAVPPSHAPILKAQTSGRTGEPVTIYKTQMNQLFYSALVVREHQWWKHDYRHKIASIRANHRQYEEAPNWGGHISEFVETGPAVGIPLNLPVRQHNEYLKQADPDMLTTHAGVLAALCSIWEQEGYTLNLKHIKNVGETLHPDTRERVKRITGVDMEDVYSSNEVNCISLECPGTGLQHTMTDTLIVEVLNEQGEPCDVGQVGRVVVTDFYNTMNPLIRYDIGDYAEVGGACPCGRHQPTLKRIIGRERGLFRRANGDRFWPTAGQYAAAQFIKINQWQIIQHSLDDIEYKLVTDEPISEEHRIKLLEIFRKTLGFENIRITEYRTQLPIDGKYEESICLIE